MLSFSKPFSLARYSPRSWVIAPDDLDQLLVDLDTSPHLPVAPRHALRQRRRMSRVEMLSQEVVEWQDPRKKRKRRSGRRDSSARHGGHSRPKRRRASHAYVPAIHVFDFALS